MPCVVKVKIMTFVQLVNCSTANFHMVVKALDETHYPNNGCSTARIHMVVKEATTPVYLSSGCSTAQFHMVVKASISSIFIIICCSTANFHMVVKVYLVLIRMAVRNWILSMILLILYLLVFFERQFKTNVEGFIFMNLYWPIGNCRYQLAFLFSLFIWQTSHFAHFSSIFQIYKW